MDDVLTKRIDARRPFPILKTKGSLLLLCTVLLGILANVLFYDQSLGVSYPVFVIAFYALFLWNVRSQLQTKVTFGWLLLIPVFLLSFTYLFFSNLIFYALNFIAIPVLIVMQTTLVTGRAGEKWYSIRFLIDLLYGFLYRPFAYIALPFMIAAKAIGSRIGAKKDSAFFKILLGMVITIPPLILIVSLLASADEIFGQLVDKLPSLLLNIDFYTFIPRTLFTGIIAILTFSYIWSLIRPDTVSSDWVRKSFREAGTVRLDAVSTITILCIINTIYVLFTLIQFSYLFGGFSFALPVHFTYAEYARRGFFELVVVTLINFSILLCLIYWTKKNGKVTHTAIRFLESLLVLCTLVMLLSAFTRMYLYEQMYGYTYLRVLTHAFMIFLFVLFLLTLCRIWREKVRLIKLYLLTALAAFVMINYVNIDVLITKYNIDRYERTGKIDVDYLATLSDDAIPEMVGLLRAKDDAVAGKIENVLFERKQELEGDGSWQSFNLSQYRSEKVLAQYDLHYDKKYDSASESLEEP
ncbi:DUF4173 domain-containing protein [Sporolactobacillus sp. THM7-7]|nr:DUF4173 domain-containing protein [Sporolactobacillus sp. THM7-7]